MVQLPYTQVDFCERLLVIVDFTQWDIATWCLLPPSFQLHATCTVANQACILQTCVCDAQPHVQANSPLIILK